ncbi:transposase [Ekhidna sp.]|uniref:transposase n=1 Tax=Ekhidna sp. TaxID=2608089 RepID=UPI0032ECB820
MCQASSKHAAYLPPRNYGAFFRDEYFNTVIESLNYCRKEKGMEIYAYCIMTSHIHLIFRAKDENPGDILRDFKTYTSKKLQK